MPYLWSEMTEIYTIFNHNYTYGNFWCRFFDTFFMKVFYIAWKNKMEIFWFEKKINIFSVCKKISSTEPISLHIPDSNWLMSWNLISFFNFISQMIRNSTSWFLRPKWPSSMVSTRNGSIKAVVGHILWKTQRG